MNSLLSKIIRRSILPEKLGPSGEKLEFTDFEMAKGFRELKIILLRTLRDIFLIALGILAAAFGLKSFLLPSKFIDGGVTGISLLISETTGVPLYALLLVINLPFIFLGVKVIGRRRGPGAASRALARHRAPMECAVLSRRGVFPRTTGVADADAPDHGPRRPGEDVQVAR